MLLANSTTLSESAGIIIFIIINFIDKSDDKNYNLVTRAMHLNAHSIIVNDWFFNSWSL